MAIESIGSESIKDPVKGIGSQELLALTIATMVNQDPFEPVSNENFMIQIAQMEAAQRSQETSKLFEEFNTRQKGLAAKDYVGDQIEIKTDDGLVRGLVTEAKTQHGEVMVNGKYYDVDSISRVLISSPKTSNMHTKA